MLSSYSTEAKSGTTLLVSLIALIASFILEVKAETVVYTLDQYESVIYLSGNSSGEPFIPQQTGGLETRFRGTLQANRSASTLALTGGRLVGLNSGQFSPAPGSFAGSSPANYGFTFFYPVIGLSVFTAVREVEAVLTSPQLEIENGEFSSNQLSIQLVAGSLDLSLGFPGTELNAPVDNEPFFNTATPGQIERVGLRERVVIPINGSQIVSITGSDNTLFQYTGQIVASRKLLRSITSLKRAVLDTEQ